MPRNASHILSFSEIARDRHAEVGGKNASLRGLIAALKDAGIAVPDGFAVTVSAYRRFMDHNGLAPFVRDQVGHRVKEHIGEAERMRRSRMRASAAE